MTTHTTPAPAASGRADRTRIHSDQPSVGTPAAPKSPVDGNRGEPSRWSEVSADLTEILAARQRQLDALPAVGLDPVAAAYRASVERILGDVRTAYVRLQAGLYGICTGCSGEISVERLELRPWATTCARCGARDRH